MANWSQSSQWLWYPQRLLDLIPVLDRKEQQSVRVFSKPNKLMLMDGIARTLWAHSKPLDYLHEQLSLVFNCPEFRTKAHTVPFGLEGTFIFDRMTKKIQKM